MDGLLAQVVEEDGLELGVQMGLGLLHEQQSEVSLGCILQLGEYGRDEQQVRVAEPRLREIAGVEADLLHAQAQSSRDRAQCGLGEAETRRLVASSFGEPRETLLHGVECFGDRRDVADLLELLSDASQEGLPLLRFAKQALDDVLNAVSAAGRQLALDIAKRREVEVPDAVSRGRFGVGVRVVPVACAPGDGPAGGADGRRGVGVVVARRLPVAVEGLVEDVEVALLAGGVAGRELDGLTAPVVVCPLGAAVAVEVVAVDEEVTLAVQRRGQQPDGIEDVRLAGVVLAHQHGDAGLEVDLDVGKGAEAAEVKLFEVHGRPSRSDCGGRRACTHQPDQ